MTARRAARTSAPADDATDTGVDGAEGVDYAADDVADPATLSGFHDEYDRRVEGQRAAIHEAATRSGPGVDHVEVIERDLDRTALRAVGDRGRTWLRAHRAKWVFRGGMGGREGARVAEHEGNGFFVVRPSAVTAIRPAVGIERDDAWLLGDLILMAETFDNYKRRIARVARRREWLDSGARAHTVEEINRIARDEGGAGARNLAFDESVLGTEQSGSRPAHADYANR